MKVFRFKTLRSRLIFWFLLLSFLPLTIALTVTFIQRVEVIKKREFEKLTAIRDLKVQQISRWMEERLADLMVVSGDYEVRNLEHTLGKSNYSETDFQNIKIVKDVIRRSLKNYGDYEEIFVINAKTGKVEASTKDENAGKNVSTDPYFTGPRETGRSYIKDIYYNLEEGEEEMTFSAPVFSLTNSEEIIAVIVLEIDLQNSLYKLLNNKVGLGKTGETLIVNKEVMALNRLQWYDNAPLKLKITAQPATRASQGETGIIESVDYAGNQVLAAYTYIPEAGWGFVAKQNMEEIDDPIEKMLRDFILIFLLSSVFIVFVAFILGRAISKPVLEMNRIASKIKSGDYSIRTSVDLEDELGTLATELNNMTDVIEQRVKIQDGVSQITDSMLGAGSMHDFSKKLLIQLIEVSGAKMAAFYVLNEVTGQFEHFNSIGANIELLPAFTASHPQGEFGNALSTKNIFHLKEFPENTKFLYRTVAGSAVPKEMVTIPVIVDETVVAVISLASLSCFAEGVIQVLRQAWVNINTSYASLIANERTKILSQHLTRVNEQLEIQARELQEQAEELQEQTEELQATSDELQKQNVTLNQQQTIVESANKLKSEFLSNMSHELRTPLNSILALTRVLMVQAKEKLDNDENNYLEIVERNGRNLLSLINNILDLSKIESGKMDVMIQPVSLKNLLHTNIENVRSLAEEKNIEVQLELPDDLPWIETDEMRLYQALTNVLGNAVKFTLKGRITVSATCSDEKVQIKIEDTGIGIAKEILPFIFDEFRQADGSTSRKFEGTGLGLAIAKKMINILGGEISVESVLGRGSVFYIELPLTWDESRKNNQVAGTAVTKVFRESGRQNPVHLQTSENTETKKGTEKINVLIADKNTDSRVATRALIQDYFEIGEVATIEELIFNSDWKPPGIILLAPETLGEEKEMLEKIKMHFFQSDIKVIIVTAQAMKGDREKFLGWGFDGYVSKPVHLAEIVEEIFRLSGKDQKNRNQIS